MKNINLLSNQLFNNFFGSILSTTTRKYSVGRIIGGDIEGI